MSDQPGQRLKTSVTAAALLAGLALVSPARAETAAPACVAPLDLIRLANPLPRLAQKIASGEPVTIVAIGSSSTSGAGASSPAANYPSRLAIELKQHFPKLSFTVLNRGVGGEEVADMLSRFDSAVLAEKPDLVLWQLGTNSVIRGHMLGGHDALIRTGLAKIRDHRRRYRTDRSAVRAKGHRKARRRAHGHVDFRDGEARRRRSLPPLRCHAALARRRSDRLRDVCFARRAPHE